MARKVAVGLYNERKPSELRPIATDDIKTETLKQYNGIPVYYIFNLPGTSFAIISADQRIAPVLGYSFESTFDAANTPDCFDWLTYHYSEQIYHVVSQNMVIKDRDVIALWELYLTNYQPKSNQPPLPSPAAVTPLTTTTWSQGCYYNANCPADNTLGTNRCGRVPTGCVATAFGQVLKYHNHPAQGTGSNSYSSTYGTMSANFGATTYNWGAMPNKLLAPNANVAQLLNHTGISVNMNYTANSSSAFTTAVRTALVNNFKYATSAQNLTKSSYTNTQWENTVRTELDAQRIVIISGFDPTANAGHAFIADGYQGTNSFHINWGWNGSSDGYFLLSALSPGSYSFNTNVGAIIGIKPLVAVITCSMVTGLTSNNITSTSATLNWAAGTGGSANTFNIKYKTTSSSTWTTVTSATNSVVISGLTPATSYHYQIQRVCGGNSTSNYTSSSTFTTLAATSNNVTVNVGTGSSMINIAPYGTSNMDERCQFIITKNELVAAGYASPKNYIKSLAFNVTTASSQVMNGFTIRVGHTTSASFSTSFLTSTMTTVFSGNVTATSGWNTHTFASAFQYNGSSNLLVEICWNNSSSTSNSFVTYTNTSAAQTIYNKTNVANGSVCSNSTGQTSLNRPNMRLVFSSSALKMDDEIVIEPQDENSALPAIANNTSMNVYPNPARNTATIEIDGTIETEAQLNVFDLTGKRVFSDVMNANNYSLSVENYPSGIYFVVVQNGDKNYKQKLVVKKDF